MPTPAFSFVEWILLALASAVAYLAIARDLRIEMSSAQLRRFAFAIQLASLLAVGFAVTGYAAVIVNPCRDLEPYSLLWWLNSCWLFD